MINRILTLSFIFAVMFSYKSFGADEIELVKRDQWSRVAPETENVIKEQFKPSGKPRFLSIHYTSFLSRHRTFDEPGLIRNLQNGHINDRKYGDIAYHFIVGISGKVYEGRPIAFAPASGTYYHSDSELEGASYGSNGGLATFVGGKKPGNTEGHITVSFNLGLKGHEEFPEQIMRRSATFIAQILLENGLTPTDIRAHREIANSICPGDFVYEWLRGPKMQGTGRGPGMILIESEFARLSR